MAIIANEQFNNYTSFDFRYGGEWEWYDGLHPVYSEPVWLLENSSQDAYGNPYGGVTTLGWTLEETLMSRYTSSTTDPEPENDIVIKFGLYEYDAASADLELKVDDSTNIFAAVDFDHDYGSGEIRSGTADGIDYYIESKNIGNIFGQNSYSDHYHDVTLTVPSYYFSNEQDFKLHFTNPQIADKSTASWGISDIIMYEDNPVVPQYVMTSWAGDFENTRITTLDFNEGLGSLWNDYLQELEGITNVTDQMIGDSAAYNFYDESGTQGYTTAHLEDQLVDRIGGVFHTFATGVGNGDSLDHFAEELWKANELQDSQADVNSTLTTVQAGIGFVAGIAAIAAAGPEFAAASTLAGSLAAVGGTVFVANDAIGKVIDSNPEDPNFVPDDVVESVTDAMAGMDQVYNEALGTLYLYGEDALAEDLIGKYLHFGVELAFFTKELAVMSVVDDLFRDKQSGFFGGETFERHGEWEVPWTSSGTGTSWGIPEVEVFEDLGLDVHVGYNGSGTHAKVTVTETAETPLSGISGFEYDAIIQAFGTPPKWIESEDFSLIA
ncbi:MAG: hypothetical protein RID91_11890 [Azospirillaceae bacterium]